ncbi:MAG: hypothetical protein ACYDAQ_01210 [Mycobacteriales bacterium]
MKQPSDWANLDLAGDPILIVGRRPKPRVLEGYVLDLHSETFPTMRAIAQTTTEALHDRQPLAWHPNADMIIGEQYLAVDVTDLPTKPPSSEPSPTEDSVAAPPLADAADLIRLVLAPGELDNLDPAALASERFRFYAIVWEQADAGQPSAFVSEYDPTTVLKKASSYFRYDGTLRSTATPDFALDDRADLIITTTDIAILNPAAFDRLFADIRALLNDVPTYVMALKTAMTSLSMSAATEAAIAEVCAKKPSFARQLQNLSTSPHTASITAHSLRTVLKRHGQTPADFLTKDALTIDAAHVSTFLDVAEGRWYEADFTSEPRRAARWSRRE